MRRALVLLAGCGHAAGGASPATPAVEPPVIGAPASLDPPPEVAPGARAPTPAPHVEVVPASSLLATRDLGAAFDGRVYIRRLGYLRLTADGAPVVDGTGVDASFHRHTGEHTAFVVVSDGLRPRIAIETGAIRLLAHVDRDDLFTVTVRRTPVAPDVPPGSAVASHVSLPAGAIVAVDPARPGPRTWITYDGLTCPLAIAGWVSPTAIGEVFPTETIVDASARPLARDAPRLLHDTELRATPRGAVVASVRASKYTRSFPMAVEVIGAPVDGAQLVSYECEGVRVRGFVDEHAVQASGVSTTSYGSYGFGGTGLCDGAIPATDAVDLPRGTLLYGNDSDEPVAITTFKRSFRQRERDGVRESCVATEWGDLWLRQRAP